MGRGRCTTNPRPVEILHPLFVTRTREKGRSMNFARVVHEIFKGGEDQGGSWPCLIYYLVRCLYPSDVYKWYSTMINNRLEIHLLPSALLFLRVSFSLLPFSLSLFSFHVARPCYRVPGCADRVEIRCLTRIREIDPWNGSFVLTTLETGKETIQIAASNGSEYLLGPLKEWKRDGGRESEKGTPLYLVLIPAFTFRYAWTERLKGRKGGCTRGCSGVEGGERDEGRRSEEAERSAFMPSGSKFAPSRRGSGRFLLHLALNLRI